MIAGSFYVQETSNISHAISSCSYVLNKWCKYCRVLPSLLFARTESCIQLSYFVETNTRPISWYPVLYLIDVPFTHSTGRMYTFLVGETPSRFLLTILLVAWRYWCRRWCCRFSCVFRLFWRTNASRHNYNL